MQILKDSDVRRASTIACVFSMLVMSVSLLSWKGTANHLEGLLVAYLAIGASLIGIALFFALVGFAMLRYVYGRSGNHEGTGLPNLTAMRIDRHAPGTTIVIAINNLLDIASELGAEGRDAILRKAAHMIEIGTHGSKVYQIEHAGFAWRGPQELEGAIQQLQNILALLRSGVPFTRGAIDIYATAGIDNSNGTDVDKAVTNAIIAAKRANNQGTTWELYEEDDSDEGWKISVASEVAKAIADGNLWVAYQPKVNSKSGDVIGAEALIRWEHPEHGEIQPDSFIPLLEKAKRMDEVTRFVIDKAVKDFKGIDGRLSVAVNVSPLMFGEGRLVEMVRQILTRHLFPSDRLTIEITESERFNNPEAVLELEILRDMGVNVSIDDYGMGNCTVNYLKMLPATELKIDRSFIANVLSNNSDRVVVASTVKLAHEMGMKVVAEGVETKEIQTYLRELECDYIQGYHAGKPSDIEAFKRLAAGSRARGSSQRAA